MKYDVTLNGKIYEVEVERGEAILVSVADAPVAAPAAAPVTVTAAPAAAPAAPAAPAMSGEAINSPMPGTILGVKVAAGDDVKKGQILLILEAMKMENEIVAPRDGKIAAVAVTKGAKVETGTPLLSLA